MNEPEEWHESPAWNGVYHKPIWVKQWVSNETNNEPPDGIPLTCALCGIRKEP